jgi:hypothetical protein
LNSDTINSGIRIIGRASMTIREIMQYIESEYSVINDTPCEVCGGDFFAEELTIDIVDGVPYDVCDCVCSSCGSTKTFEFFAPFFNKNTSENIKNNLN